MRRGQVKLTDPKKLNAKVFGKTGTAENPHGEDMHGLLDGWIFKRKILYCNSSRKCRIWWGYCQAQLQKIFLTI